MSTRQRWLHMFTAIMLVLTMFGAAPEATRAQTTEYLVDNLGDASLDDPQPSYCTDATENDCSLRQAMELADSDGGASRITFLLDLSNGVITLTNFPLSLPRLDTEDNTVIDGLIDPIVPLSPKIAINGNTGDANGIRISTKNNTIRGLSFYGFDCGLTGAGAILIESAAATGNVIERNYIGPDLTGTAPTNDFRNCSGVFIRQGASGNSVLNNVIGGNERGGVVIDASNSNIVRGNLIGLQLNPTQTALPNGRAGVAIIVESGSTANGNIIGGDQSLHRNVISSNGEGPNPIRAGVLLQGTGVTSNTVAGNFIGLRSDGTLARGNNGDGIRLELGAKNNNITGSSGAPQVIGSNKRYGIRITGNGTTNNTVSGVYVGTATNGGPGTGGNGFPNEQGGILIDAGASGNTISGTPTSRMLVSGNLGFGVSFSGNSSSGNKLRGAYIGIVPNPAATSTTLKLPNIGNGVQISTARNSEVTGANYISGNTGYAIRLTNTQTTTIKGNFVGLALNQTNTVSNTLGGIYVESTSGLFTRNTLIGGSDGERNIISGNDGPGLTITGTNTVSSTVSANLFGLSKTSGTTFTNPAGNVQASIIVTGGAKRTTITRNTVSNGREAFGEPNGTGEGILVSGTGTTTTTLTLNRIGPPTDAAGTPGSNRGGLWITGGPVATTVTSNTIVRNTGDAIQATDTTTMTISGNRIANNAGIGILVGGASDITSIRDNTIDDNEADGIQTANSSRNTTIISNTIIRNDGLAVRVVDTAQRTKIQDNVVTQNGGGILLDGATTGSAGTRSAPNHDIDPPILDGALRLRINENGVLSGYVYTSTVKLENGLEPASACVTCTIQIFTSDPEQPLPDGQGFVKIAEDVLVTDPTGRFSTQIFGFAQARPRQVLLTATDGYGHTSEYAIFNVETGLRLVPVNPVPPEQTAAPGDIVTYTHRLENIGTLDLSDIQLSTESVAELNWTTTISPSTSQTPLALPAGESTLVSVTLTLPTGSAENVRAGLKDITRLIAASAEITTAQATVLMTTTVLSKATIIITPQNQNGSGKPGTQVAYVHTIRNNGNITATVTLAARTLDPAQGTLWSTTLSATTVEVPPGTTRDFTVRVTVPAGAQERFNGQPVRATTYITGTVANFPDQTRVVSDVTSVTLVPRATMLRDENTFAAAGETVRIRHRVENISNGTATFRLVGSSSSGSVIRFIGDTVGVTLTNGVFTLSNRSDPLTGETNVFNFFVEIVVDDRLLPGAVDVINISLTETNGTVIGGANVQDRITITAGLVRPRLYLPMIFKQQAQ
jgi:parallel beta-helix repeat protein